MYTDKHRWRMVGRAGIGLLVVVFFALAISVWRSPTVIIKRYSLMERRGEKGEENGLKMVAELIRCGPKAIPVLVEEIRDGWWERGQTYYPLALAGFGQIGKDALIAAIDIEKDPSERISLITALHSGFQDYSRSDEMFEACRSVEAGDYMVSMGLEYMFGRFATLEPEDLQKAPSLMVEKKLNEEFVFWWNKNGLYAVERMKMKFSQQTSK